MNGVCVGVCARRQLFLLLPTVACAYLVMCVCATTVAGAAATQPRKKAKSLDDVDLEMLEKQWQQGDDQWELKNEFDYQASIAQKKVVQQTPFDDRDPNAWLLQNPSAVGGTGAQMMFVELTKKQPDGAAWTKEDVDKLGSLWKDLLMTGGTTVTTYNIGEVMTGPERSSRGKGKKRRKRLRQQILVSLDKGWQTQDAVHFLTEQEGVELVTWNNQKFFGKRRDSSTEL